MKKKRRPRRPRRKGDLYTRAHANLLGDGRATSRSRYTTSESGGGFCRRDEGRGRRKLLIHYNKCTYYVYYARTRIPEYDIENGNDNVKKKKPRNYDIIFICARQVFSL